MKILVIPDSFKGSLSSVRVCEIAREILTGCLAGAEVKTMPLADGGEGTLDCILSAVKGERVAVTVQGPLGNPVRAELGFLSGGRTAVIEAAQAVGLPLAGKELKPMEAGTGGLGQMIRAARAHGATEIVAALGGTCTNDCGAGMLSALGVRFLSDGKPFVPCGGTLAGVREIQLSQEFLSLCEGVSFRVLCDVRNPLYGKNGAAAVFAPQKGADAEQVGLLDEGMRRFAALVARQLGRDCAEESGAGAAGGLGFAFRAFLNAELVSGVEEILKLYRFSEIQENYDLIITGEGCFDRQSLMGKAVGGVLSRAKRPAAVLCGKYRPFEGQPVSLKYILELSGGQSDGYAMAHAEENLRACLKRFCQEELKHEF